MTRAAGLPHVAPRATVGTLVWACALSPVLRSRVADALKGRADLRWVDDLSALDAELRASTAEIDVIVLGERDASGQPASVAAARITRTRSRTAVVVYCERTQGVPADFRALAVAGVHQIVLAGVDDGPVALRAIIGRARHQSSAEWVLGRLRPHLPPQLHLATELVLSRPADAVSVQDLANLIGVHRKTLFNWCERGLAVSPAEFLASCRLCLVGYQLQFTACSVEAIALDLAYASDTALRNALKRYTGMTATQLRQREAFEVILEAMLRRIGRGSAVTLHMA